MSHYVVLSSVKRGKAIILDPAVGERQLGLNELSKSFTGIAIEFRPTGQFQKRSETRQFSLLSLMGETTGLKRALSQLLLLGVAIQVCTLAAPFYMQWVIDEALIASDRELLAVLGLGFLMLISIQAIIGSARSWFTTVFATDLNFQWLGNAFDHLLRLPLPYFEKRHLGDIVSRFGSIQTIQRSLTNQFVEVVIDGALVIVTLIVMFFTVCL